jgi:hypothetical protein
MPGIVTFTPGQQGFAANLNASFAALGLLPVATGDNLDTALTTKLAELGDNGGTITIPAGEYTINTPPSFADTRNVTIQGAGGVSSGAQTATRITYTGSAARAIDARSSFGFRLVDLQLLYSSASFTGKLVDLGHSDAALDATYPVIERCYLGGSGQSGAGSLISLNKTIIAAVRDCVFGPAAVAIKGRDAGADYSNSVTVDNCTFLGQTTCAVKNAGQAWEFRGCTFEQLAGGGAGAYSHDTIAANGVTFTSCWFGDADATGTWINYSGNGLHVIGCYISTGLKGIALGASSFGAVIKANDFVSMTTGVDVAASCKRLDVRSNSWDTVTNRIVTADSCAGSLLETTVDSVDVRGLPSCKAFSSIHLSIANNTATTVLFDSEEWDTGALHSTSVNTGRLTAPVAGIYSVATQILWDASTTGQRAVTIRANGSTVVAQEIIDSGGTSPQQSVSGHAKLAAGEYVEVRVTQISGGALQILGGAGLSSFSMAYLGAA